MAWIRFDPSDPAKPRQLVSTRVLTGFPTLLDIAGVLETCGQPAIGWQLLVRITLKVALGERRRTLHTDVSVQVFDHNDTVDLLIRSDMLRSVFGHWHDPYDPAVLWEWQIIEAPAVF